MSKAVANAEFFRRFQVACNSANPFRTMSGTPSSKNWIQIRQVAFPPTSAYHAGFTIEGRFRIEITFQGSDRALNKRAFDFLMERRRQIETELGQPLEWERRDSIDRSQVSWYFPAPASVLDDEQLTERYIDWAVAKLPSFQAVLDKNLSELRA